MKSNSIEIISKKKRNLLQKMYFFPKKQTNYYLKSNVFLLKSTIFKMVHLKKLDFSSQVYASMTFQYKITPKLSSTQMSKWWFFSEQEWETRHPWIDQLKKMILLQNHQKKNIFQGKLKIRHFQNKCLTLAMKPAFLA